MLDEPRLKQWLAAVVYTWLRAGVRDEDRERLLIALVDDLTEALASGATVENLIASDPRQFAIAVAAADEALPPTEPERWMDVALAAREHAPGVPAPQAGVWSFVLTALTPVLVNAIFWWWLLNPAKGTDSASGVVPAPDSLAIPGTSTGSWAGGLGYYGGAVCVLVAIAVVIVWYRFRTDRHSVGVALTAGAALLLAGIAGSGLAVAFAATTHYSTRLPVVIIEICIAVTTCLAVLAAAGWLLSRNSPSRNRRPRQRAPRQV